MADTTTGWERVGEVLSARIDYEGWSQAEFARLADVSDATIRQLQRGERTAYRQQVLTKVARALGWPSNAIRRLADDDPTAVDALVHGDDTGVWREAGGRSRPPDTLPPAAAAASGVLPSDELLRELRALGEGQKALAEEMRQLRERLNERDG